MPKVEDSGRDLAQVLQTQGTLLPALPANAVLGSVPQNFNGNPSSYTHQEILNMVIFYNDNFHILPGDDIATRHNKFREWLSIL
jgi:hypothetical protein